MYFDKDFDNLVKDYLMHYKVQEMSKYKHHGISRLEHSIRVSYYSYKVCKALKLRYKETAVAALLHDFFLDEVSKENGFNRLIHHPKYAVENAEYYFKINDFQKNIILRHMFPVTFIPPRDLEGCIVDLVDNIASVYERCSSSINSLAKTTSVIALALGSIIKFKI